MKKVSRKKIILWSLPVILLAVIALSYQRIIWHLILPDLKDIRLAELNFDDDSVRVRLDLNIHNKGWWKIDVLHTELRAFDDTVLLFVYSNDSITTLGAGNDKQARLYVTLPIRRIMERIREHKGEDSTRIRLVGEVDCSTVIGKLSSNVDTNLVVRVPVPPRVFVREVDYLGKEGPRKHSTSLQLEFRNENPRELSMRDIDYELSSERFATMSGHLDALTIAAEDSTRVAVPGYVDGVGFFGLISRIVLDNDLMQYSFVLKGTMVSLTGVTDYDVPVTIRSQGTLELYNRQRGSTPTIKIIRSHHRNDNRN